MNARAHTATPTAKASARPGPRVPTIVVTGPVGVGKTTVVGEMGYLLGNAAVPHATIDFDRLAACHPRPADDDCWGTKLGTRNLAALWRNYHAAGARRLLIARVIETREDLEGIRGAVPGAEILVVRLHARLRTLRDRVRQRRQDSATERHLERAIELAASLDARPFEDLLIETEGRGPTDIGREILQRAGWLSS